MFTLQVTHSVQLVKYIIIMISRAEIAADKQHNSNITPAFTPNSCLNEYTIIIIAQSLDLAVKRLKHH